MSEEKLQKTKKYLNENLARKFIRSFKFNAKHSILFVSKKNEIKRLCVDYRKLNDIIERNNYSLSLMNELQDRLKRAK